MKSIIDFIRKNWFYDLVLISLVLIAFSPLTYLSTIENITRTDYESHTRYAMQFASVLRGRSDTIDPDIIARGGWQSFVILIHELTGLAYDEASFVATLICILASALILFHVFKPELEKRQISPWWGLGIALGLNLVTPIFLLAPLDGRHYFGYIAMITYHNPTSIMLRPVAILQFVFALDCFREKPSPWRRILFVAFLALLGLYIKPNYAICLIPAMGLIILYRLFKHQVINWRMTLLGFALPSVIILAWQYLFVFVGVNGDRTIEIWPFAAMSVYSDYLLPKFFLSIAFPLLISILYFDEAIKDVRMILAWLVFFISMIFTYFFAEGGAFVALNFVWGGHVATWILFGLSLLFLIEKASTHRWKVWIPALVAGMHLASGIIYYGYCVLGNYY